MFLMRNWFRNFILNRVYLNSYKKPVSTRRRYGDTIRTISIILDNNLGTDKDKFNKMAELFDLSQKNMMVLTYCKSPDQISDSDINNCFTSKDISNMGIVNGVLKKFCAKKADVLINYYNRNDINLKYISSKCNKNISIGFNNIDHELNDLILDIDPKSIDLFMDECVKYLKTIYS